MLSAATAIAYAKATDRDWCIDWRDGLYAPNGVNAVCNLFQVSASWDFSKFVNRKDLRPAIWLGRGDWPVRMIISSDYPSSHSSPLIYRKVSAPLKAKAIGDETEVFWSYTSKFGRIRRYLSDSQKDAGRDGVLGHVLRTDLVPQTRIVAAAEQLLLGGKGATLGVHIRYTDLKVPIEKVIASVKRELEKHKYESIFLATDSLQAESLFRSEFSNIITQNRRYSDLNHQLHSVEAHTDKENDADSALIDLIALSKCRGLVYCSRSTFAETSRLIGDFESKRLVDVDRYNVIVRIKKTLQEYL